MRYETSGDYYTDRRGRLVFEMVDLGRQDYIIPLLVHELIEEVVCAVRGKTHAQIDAWDFAFKGNGEPGEAKGCPYYREHRFATKLENMLIKELGLNWKDYDRALQRASRMNRRRRR